MIISPNALTTVNVLHAVNNSYKCTDQVYLLSRSKDDCNLYLRRLYWERDPNDTYIPPDFSTSKQGILLIRDDLVSAECLEECPTPTSDNVVNRAFVRHNQNGYCFGGEIIDSVIRQTTAGVLPLLRPTGVSPSNAEDLHELSWFRLTRPYIQNRDLRMFISFFSNLINTALTVDNLRDLDILTAYAQRLQFGDERKVCAVLYYKPAGTVVQLMTLPQFSGTYDLVFDDRTAKDYKEPSGVSVPCFVNLDRPVTAKELFLRWTGNLSHIQVLDTPIIRYGSWEFADESTFDWDFLAERSTYVPLYGPDESGTTDAPDTTIKYGFTGGLETGIRFEHPLDDSLYSGLNYYSSFEVSSDVWELRNFQCNPTSAYRANLEEHIIPKDTDGTELSWVIRPTDDNRAYMANKSLLHGYHSWETGGWRSNHRQPSTPNQLRFLVTFPQVQFIRGCFNPVSDVAVTEGKPYFYKEGSIYRFEPGLYGNYLVPWHVLIEGRPDLKFKTKFQLIDEYTLEHFRADTHTHFSYQMPVKQLRITVQDWYGTTLLDDLKSDYIYMKGNWHYGEYSALEPHACNVVCGRSSDNVGTFLNNPDPKYDSLRAEWDLWKRRTIQSIWKGIYIPPFVFF